jgi:hypothetical protein
MTSSPDRWLTTARRAVGVAFGVLATATTLLVVSRLPRDFHGGMSDVAALLPMVAFGLVGLVILRQRPRHPVGWSFALVGVLLATGGTGSGLAAWELAPRLAEVMAATPVFPGLIALGILTFPSGRVPSPGWRWLLWLIGASFLFDLGLLVLGLETPTAELAVLLLPALASLFFRRRLATPVERQQLRWLFWVTVLFAAEVVAGATLEALGQIDESSQYSWIGDFIFMGLAMSIPVAMGVAITRYRLYDLDRFLSRTVSYVFVLGVLGVAYAGLVLAVGAVVPARNDLAVALSTMTVAFAFLPLARRVQAFVDRRFFRSRYDAAAVVANFASELRSTIDPGEVVGRAETVVEDTFQAESVSVWLAGGRQ